MPDTTMDSSFFQLSNGQYIMSRELSAVFTTIVKEHPHFNRDYHWDEMSMAELFALCYESSTRFCPEAKAWYSYDGTRWVRDSGALLAQERLKEFTRLMQLYCIEIPEETAREDYKKFIAKLGDRRVRDRILKDATGVNPISSVVFDANPYLINCLNGTYDLRDYSFREHNWQDFLTMVTNFEHTVSRDVEFPRWIGFINEVTCGDGDKADFLQRAVGYSLVGKGNEECMFILHGKTTRNGKSTLLAALQHLLGDYAQVANVGIICRNHMPKDSDAARPGLMKLKGARMVTMAESDEYGKLDEQAIKQLTGGEAISARTLYAEPVSFVPQFKMWMSCNALPAVSDKSLFASDRIKVVEFERHFSEKEQDKSLKELFQTPEAMRGIFMWAVEGYRLYMRRGLNMSDELRRPVRAYERDNDVVRMFFEARCERDTKEFLPGKKLYEAYKRWCKDNGFRERSSIWFYGEFERFGERVNRQNLQVFKGVKFRDLSTSEDLKEIEENQQVKIRLV